MGVVTLGDRQRSFNGYLFGYPEPFTIVSEEGLDDLDIRDGDREFPLDDGSIPGVHLVNSKIVILRLVTVGDRETIEANLADLDVATRVMRDNEGQYVFKQPGRDERFIRARPIRRTRARTQETEHGPVFVDVAFKAADPYTYSTSVTSVVIPVYSLTGGGFDWPIIDWPIDLNPATEQVAIAFNSGNSNAYPLLRVQRPVGSVGTVNGFTVINETTDVTFDMDVVITAGQTLYADFFAYVHSSRGVDPIHIDGSTRFSGWNHPRVPLYLAPGSNTIRLVIDGNAADTTALITFRDTYL